MLEDCRETRDIARLEAILWTIPRPRDVEIDRLALRCYLKAGRPQTGLNYFQECIAAGYQAQIADLEVLIYSLLRHSHVDNARMLFDSFRLYGHQHRTASYNLWIGHFLRDSQPEKARLMFKDMEEKGLKPNQSTYQLFLTYFIEKNDLKSAESIRDYMRSQKLVLDARFYNGIIASWSKRQAIKKIEDIVVEMRQDGVLFTKETYDILIRTYAQAGQHAQVQRLFEAMRHNNLQPTTHTFNQMLKALSHCLKPEETRDILLQMSKMGLTFNSFTHAAIIINLLRQDKPKEAVEMILQLQNKEISLAIESYSEILRICCQLKLDIAVKLIHEQMKKFNVPQNNYIYSILIRHFLLKRNYSKVDGLLLEMHRKWGLKPNPYVFSCLLNHYVEVLDIPRLQALIKMAQESDIEINSVMYDVIMKCFYLYSRYQQGGHICRAKGLDKDPAAVAAPSGDLAAHSGEADESINFDGTPDYTAMNIDKLKQQFEGLFGLPFRPTVHVYNEMMLSFFVRERFSEIFACLQDMRRNDVVPNKTTYTFMIKARIFEGNLAEARLILQQMIQTGQKPTLLHCALFFHAYCKRLMTEEAEGFLVDMEKIFQIRPNHVFYGSLIYSYTRRREYSRVFSSFERMEKAGFVPDTETCNYVLISLLEINEFTEARKFFEKMLLRGIRRNTHTYSYLADGFLARSDDKSLLTILSDCTGSENTIDAYPFNQIMMFYYRADRREDIVKVLVLMNEYCVQYTRETLPFLKHILPTLKHDKSSLHIMVRLVEKMLVDLAQDAIHIPLDAAVIVKEHLDKAGMHKELEEFEQFLAALTDIRRLWTTVDPSVLEAFSEHLHMARDHLEDTPEAKISTEAPGGDTEGWNESEFTIPMLTQMSAPSPSALLHDSMVKV